MTDEHVIATDRVSKHYGNGIVAVDELSLNVRRGEVYGFVGPNGAGKTTTLRMIAGLVRPTSGSIQVLGAPAGSKNSVRGVGAMIEQPAFYPYLSGQDNLRVMSLHASIPATRISEVLEQVELTVRAGDAYRTYSMGMKQRLALAAALLKDPELLILDEPTNGLDPEGIAEMRGLIRGLGTGRRTVLLSSHLMSEVEQICDRVGVIRQGQLVAEGPIDELRGHPQLHIIATPTEGARQLLSDMSEVGVVREHDGVLLVSTDPRHAAEINRRLVYAGIDVSEIRAAAQSLEQVFFKLVQQKGEADDVEPAGRSSAAA
ncbi:MAG: ABC transporter ATP-binding protein [Nitrolancea sp.]